MIWANGGAGRAALRMRRRRGRADAHRGEHRDRLLERSAARRVRRGGARRAGGGAACARGCGRTRRRPADPARRAADHRRRAGPSLGSRAREHERTSRRRRPERHRVPGRARLRGERGVAPDHERRGVAPGVAGRRAHEPHAPAAGPAARRPRALLPIRRAQLRARGALGPRGGRVARRARTSQWRAAPGHGLRPRDLRPRAGRADRDPRAPSGDRAGRL